MRAKVSASVFPTEEGKRVKQAILNIFPDAELQEGDGNISGDAGTLERFRELLEQRKTQGTAEAILIRGFFDGKASLLLNKQAATAGVLNTYEEHPLEPISLELECSEDELHAIVWG